MNAVAATRRASPSGSSRPSGARSGRARCRCGYTSRPPGGRRRAPVGVRRLPRRCVRARSRACRPATGEHRRTAHRAVSDRIRVGRTRRRATRPALRGVRRRPLDLDAVHDPQPPLARAELRRVLRPASMARCSSGCSARIRTRRVVFVVRVQGREVDAVEVSGRGRYCEASPIVAGHARTLPTRPLPFTRPTRLLIMQTTPPARAVNGGLA